MRFLVTVSLVLFGLQSFAATTKATKKKSTTTTQTKTVPTKQVPAKQVPAKQVAPKSTPSPTPTPLQVDPLKGVSTAPYQRFPLHSVLHHVPWKNLLAQAEIKAEFGSYNIETPSGGVTLTEGYQQQIFGSTLGVEYGVLPKLAIGANLGYQTSTDKNTDYRDTASGVQPLWPDVTNKGITDPNLVLDWRPLDSSFVLDFSGDLQLGVNTATRGTVGSTRTSPATQGNQGSGSYAAIAGVRAGLQVTESFNAIAELAGTYNFAGQVTMKTNSNDLVVNRDPSFSFLPGVEVEYFISKEFVLNPFARVQFNPKMTASSNTGVITTFETAAAKTYNVGVNGTYLVSEGFAVRAGYSYSSTESHIIGVGVGGNPATAENYKDQDAHILTFAVLAEF